MRTLGITGIGGFIGRRIAERALERDWNIRGFDIDPAGVDYARGLGAEATVGDVVDPAFLADFFEGVDVAVHTAAIVDETGDPRQFYRVNVEGTRHVVDAARRADVDILVHLSSVMVYGFDYPDGVDESFEFPAVDNIYCETKRESEKVARSLHDPDRTGVVVLRPGDVYGAGSVPWVLRPLEMLESGMFRVPAVEGAVINHVYVDNLVDALFGAVDREAIGEVFNVTDETATDVRQFFAHHAAMLGQSKVPTMPLSVLKAVSKISIPLFRLAGIDPPASPEAIDFLRRTGRVSARKAREQLDYTPRVDLEEGMQRVARRLRRSGRIPGEEIVPNGR